MFIGTTVTGGDEDVTADDFLREWSNQSVHIQEPKLVILKGNINHNIWLQEYSQGYLSWNASVLENISVK